MLYLILRMVKRHLLMLALLLIRQDYMLAIYPTRFFPRKDILGLTMPKGTISLILHLSRKRKDLYILVRRRTLRGIWGFDSAYGRLGTHLTLDLTGRIRFGPDIQWVS